MNVEEIIEKKEKRGKVLKKIFVVIFIILILGIAVFGIYKLIPILREKTKMERNDTNQISQTEENDVENKTEQDEQKGIGNGENVVNYKGYSYVSMYDSNLNNYVIKKISNNKEDNEEDNVIFTYNQNGVYDYNIWIYKDNLYCCNGGSIKVISLDNIETKDLISSKSTIYKVGYDFNNELIFYRDNDENMYIYKLDGTLLKQYEQNKFDGYSGIFLITDKENLFYVTQKSVDDRYKNKYTLYKINKNSLEMNTITQIEIEEGWYGGGIYQAEQYGDYVYFVAGSSEGSGGYFNGDLYRVKTDGTKKENLSNGASSQDAYFSEHVIPEMVIYDNYAYYDGLKINLENNEKSYDIFSNGDIFDDEGYEYTTSLSTENKIIVTKFKAGTDGENKTEIFTKDIPNGATVDKQKIKLIYDKKKIYVTITYKDMDNRSGAKAWAGVDYLTETYKMDKDGNNATQI